MLITQIGLKGLINEVSVLSALTRQDKRRQILFTCIPFRKKT